MATKAEATVVSNLVSTVSDQAGQLTVEARGVLSGTGFSRSGSTYTLAGLLAGTAVMQNSLDTTAGRLLSLVSTTGAFGLGGVYGPLLANLDATSIPAGLYFFNTSGGTAGTNPGFAFGAVIVASGIAAGTQAPMMIALERSASAGRMAWRNSQGGTWGAWRTVMGRGDMLGTVSQSGGVPTGALLETGTNANGRYTRHADGRQICEHARTVTGGGDDG